jgi:hypothetical protein
MNPSSCKYYKWNDSAFLWKPEWNNKIKWQRWVQRFYSGGLAAVIYTDTLSTLLMVSGSLILMAMGKYYIVE